MSQLKLINIIFCNDKIQVTSELLFSVSKNNSDKNKPIRKVILQLFYNSTIYNDDLYELLIFCYSTLKKKKLFTLVQNFSSFIFYYEH